MPRFVIQQHAATSLHYDFRLEAEGTLKSWAVPKGPSTDPRDKRLAVPVPDHSLAHGDFEGALGSGAVIIWDKGEYHNLGERPIDEELRDGHASFWLEGEKLVGGWTLHRVADDRWLLIKKRDEEADARRNPVSTQPESVKSGRTIEELKRSSR
jgi:DNA ligase D-like protein (predicted 3'-phosphoesterase)